MYFLSSVPTPILSVNKSYHVYRSSFPWWCSLPHANTSYLSSANLLTSLPSYFVICILFFICFLLYNLTSYLQQDEVQALSLAFDTHAEAESASCLSYKPRWSAPSSCFEHNLLISAFAPFLSPPLQFCLFCKFRDLPLLVKGYATCLWSPFTSYLSTCYCLAFLAILTWGDTYYFEQIKPIFQWLNIKFISHSCNSSVWMSFHAAIQGHRLLPSCGCAAP